MPAFIVVGLSLYFALLFGIGAVRALLSPLSGFEDFATAEIALAIARTFRLGANGLAVVGASVGAAKLAVGGFFFLYLIERLAHAWRGTAIAEHDTLEVALLCAGVLTAVLAMPAWSAADYALVRAHLANLMLITVIAGVSYYEREAEPRPATRVAHLDPPVFQPRPVKRDPSLSA
jgi:hypothetical protein